MCRVCDQFGDGEKWYFNRKNYGYKLGDDAGFEEFRKNWGADWHNWQTVYERVKKLEAMKHHQVIPLEDALRIVDITNEMSQDGYGFFCISDCLCVKTTIGETIQKCMGFGASQEATRTLKEFRSKVNVVPAEELKAKLIELDRKGYVKTIDGWAMDLGKCYVSHICNCSLPTCTKLRAKATWGFEFTSKGEYVAEVNPLECTGCRRCQSYCQFGALLLDPASRQAYVDARLCQGCGVCRQQCEPQAIRLVDRARVLLAKTLW